MTATAGVNLNQKGLPLSDDSAEAPGNVVHLAAIEGGGTTFVVSVARVIANDDDTSTATSKHTFRIGPTLLELCNSATIPSKDPETVIEETCAFLQQHLPPCGYYSAAAIATFGPINCDQTQQTYGTILPGTPKKEWRGVDLLSPIRRACGLDNMPERVAFDTDVNAPALAEFTPRCHYLR